MREIAQKKKMMLRYNGYKVLTAPHPTPRVKEAL